MNHRMFIYIPNVVLSARVNMPVITYPLEFVEYDGVISGSYASVRVGMTVIFGSAAGASDLGRMKITAITNHNIFMGYVPNGAPGDGVLDIYDNCYFSVLNEYLVWPKQPWFNPTDKTIQAKDGYYGVGDNLLKPPPVANAGGAAVGTINPATEVLTVQFSGANSFQFEEPSDGIGPVDEYLWNFVDGNIVSGSTTTSSVTVEFPPGFRYISLRVGKSYGVGDVVYHTTYVPVYARDPEDDDSFDVDIATLQRGREGQTVSVKLHQTLSRRLYRPGSLALVWDDDLDTTSVDRKCLIISGWITAENNSVEGGLSGDTKESVIQVEDVASKMRNTRAFSQAQEYTETPTIWAHTKFPNLAYYIWYLLFWHSTVVEIADLYWPYNYSMAGLEFQQLGSDAGDLFSQVNAVANAMTPDHMVNCTRIGQLIITYDPMLQPLGTRDDEVDTEIQWSDIISINYTYNPTIRVGRITTYAFLGVLGIHPDDLEMACMAPTEGRGIGVQDIEISNKIAPSQGALNDCEGNRYAKLNAPFGPVTIGLGWKPEYNHLFEPAANHWVDLLIPEDYLPYRDNQPGIDPEINGRGLISNVDFSFSSQAGGTVANVTVTWEKETWGLPASLLVLEDPPDEEE